MWWCWGEEEEEEEGSRGGNRRYAIRTELDRKEEVPEAITRRFEDG